MAQRPKISKKNIPKSIHEMSPEVLKETLKKKRECDAKALKIVELLCETSVDEEWFLANLQFINQCHFDDVTIERAITKLCGYPLCNQKLDKVSPQQYQISTRYNKVFDITERKNFCSSCCYKSAMHVKQQLFTSPLWFRDQEIIPKYTVLKTFKSSLGEEVVLIPNKIKPESDDMKKNNINSNETVNLDKDIEELEKKSSNLQIVDSEKPVHNKSETKNSVGNTGYCDIQKEIKETNIKDVEEKPLKNLMDIPYENFRTPQTIMKKDEPLDIINKIEKCIFEWFSVDTFFYLYGEEKIKELLKDKAAAVKDILNSKLSLAGHNDKISRMIQLYGLLDTVSFSSTEIKTNLKPLPDYSLLKEEGKTLEIKVRAFYQGQLQVKQPEKEDRLEEKESSAETEPIYLPLIDTHAQIALRKKIVLDKINKVLPELMKVFGSDFVLQMNEVRNLVSTFALSAHNITFKPALWYLIGVILIKLLSIKDKKLESILNLESSVQQISIILMNFELQKHYLDNLVDRLTGSVNLMEKLNEIKR